MQQAAGRIVMAVRGGMLDLTEAEVRVGAAAVEINPPHSGSNDLGRHLCRWH